MDPWANLGVGNTLRGKKSVSPPAIGRVQTPISPPRDVIDATMLDEDDFTFGEEYVEGDEDDIIEIDSD